MSQPEQKPSVGRIVHFWDGGSKPLAAIITHVVNEETGIVNLTLFEQVGSVSGRLAVAHRFGNAAWGWDWPERI